MSTVCRPSLQKRVYDNKNVLACLYYLLLVVDFFNLFIFHFYFFYLKIKQKFNGNRVGRREYSLVTNCLRTTDKKVDNREN